MKFIYELRGDKELRKKFREMAEKESDVKKAVGNAGLDVQRRARLRLRDENAWDTGHLSRSTLVEPKQSGFAADIFPTAPYGLYVEFGTKPHFPPPDALAAWAHHHGFDSAWPICRAIAKRGLKARPFLFPALEDAKPGFIAELERICEEAVR